jgi:hypothetical protein
MRILVIISIIAILSACNNTKEKGNSEVNQTTAEPKFDLPKSEYVILPYDTSWYWVFKGAEQTELSKSELVEIEKIIENAVVENNKQQNDELTKHNNTYPDNQWTETGFELKTKGFKRQYVPVINENGEKEVWINFFCDDWGSENWKSDILMVHDGGNCYFNLKVKLTNKTYSELSINGYA